MSRDKKWTPLGWSAWWLDFAEGELDPATRVEMKALLRHSQKDQEIVQAFKSTKERIKRNEEPLPEMSEDFFDGLHDKIMAQVEHRPMAKAPLFQFQQRQKRWVAASLSVTLSLLMMVALISFLSHQSLNTQWDVPGQIAIQAQDHPDDMALFMTYQNEHDFFVDVASQSFDHLTKEQFEDLIKSTKTR